MLDFLFDLPLLITGPAIIILLCAFAAGVCFLSGDVCCRGCGCIRRIPISLARYFTV
jgi:hypothetical protein